MTRRGLLLALIAMLAAGIFRWVREVRGRSRTPTLEGRLRAHFDYLPLDDEVLAAFARDYRSDAARAARREGIEPIASRFLLSTDFFQTGADESRPPRYVMYYDPYRSPCYNPLRAPLGAEGPGRVASGGPPGAGATRSVS